MRGPFGGVELTDYDLQFHVGSIPVRVTPWFWLAGVLLGQSALRSGLDFLLVWLLVVFVSILVHELGHALTAMYFGYPAQIVLYHFGGLAYCGPESGYTRAKSIAISLAGPAAGFVLYIIVETSWRPLLKQVIGHIPEHTLEVVRFAIGSLIWVNLYWGLVNLLPVLPLDGGRVCERLCTGISPRAGLRWTGWIGAVTGIGVALLAIQAQDLFLAILFGVMGLQSLQLARGESY